MTDLSLHTTIAVCDTQPTTAAGVRAVLDACPDLEFLWVSVNLDDAARRARLYPPCVLLADKALGVNALVQWVLSLRAAGSRTVVVVWGTSMTEAEALRFIQAGAKGVIRKAATTDMLVSCLRSAGTGSTWLEDAIFRNTTRAPSARRSELTPREEQVFGLVEQGLTNGEIAHELGIRPGTVKIHLKHLYEKTGMRSRYHLALSGLKNKGILSMTA